MKITIFNSLQTNGKTPVSPYNDKTFIFKTLDVENPSDAFRILSNNFTLNITLDLHEPLRLRRRVQDLQNYYPKTVDWVLIDVDHVDSKYNQTKILQYFKNYKCIIGESRSCNDVDNFNLKGFLFIQPIEVQKLRPLIEQIHDDLEKYGDIDLHVSQRSALNAPMNKYKILLESDGPEYVFTLRARTQHEQSTFENLTDVTNTNITDISDISNIDFNNVNSISDLCLKVFESLGFTALKANSNCVVFKHFLELKTIGGYFWFKDSPYIMHHYNETKSVNIYNDVIKLPKAKELLQNSINYADELQNLDTNSELLVVNEKYLTVTEAIKEEIYKFILKPDGLFSIRSPMGSAKSVIIEEIIKQANEHDLRVLICSSRISVAEDFSKKYNIKLYNKHKYEIGDSLIVQYDSLWKYNIRMFDLVILDEFISLMIHSRNNLSNSNVNLSKLLALTKKKLVIADAFLTGYENKFLEHKKSNRHIIQNEYRDDTKLYEYENFNFFIQVLLQVAKKHKITISCTQLNIIKALKKLLNKYNLRVITLTADTEKATKELIYKVFEKSKNDKYDVLIFSPTLTVGVSNLNNIDYHFHYDCSNTCDVISSLQMIKRTRKAKQIHYFIKNKVNFVKTSFNDIRDSYAQNLGTQLELSLLFELNDYGEPRLTKLGKNAVYIDLFKNILEYNHKNAFRFLLQYQFKTEIITVTKTFESNILLPYIKDVKQNNELEIEEKLKEYMLLSDISKYISIQNVSSNIFETLYEYENRISCSDNNIKNNILKLAIKDKHFIQKCRKLNIIELFSKTLDQKQIQTEISECISKNVQDVQFWNNVLKYITKPLQKNYAIAETKFLRSVLDECGYKVKIINHKKMYCINTEVDLYRKYVE